MIKIENLTRKYNNLKTVYNATFKVDKSKEFGFLDKLCW